MTQHIAAASATLQIIMADGGRANAAKRPRSDSESAESEELWRFRVDTGVNISGKKPIEVRSWLQSGQSGQPPPSNDEVVQCHIPVLKDAKAWPSNGPVCGWEFLTDGGAWSPMMIDIQSVLDCAVEANRDYACLRWDNSCQQHPRRLLEKVAGKRILQ